MAPIISLSMDIIRTHQFLLFNSIKTLTIDKEKMNYKKGRQKNYLKSNTYIFIKLESRVLLSFIPYIFNP